MEFRTQTQEGIEKGEELVTLYRVFDYFDSDTKEEIAVS